MPDIYSVRCRELRVAAGGGAAAAIGRSIPVQGRSLAPGCDRPVREVREPVADTTSAQRLQLSYGDDQACERGFAIYAHVRHHIAIGLQFCRVMRGEVGDECVDVD